MSDEQPHRRKTRTRGHVIADLGVNYLERQILLAGHTMQRITHDYGIDTFMTTYAPDGQIEYEVVWFQVKSTDSIQTSADEKTVSVRVASADLRYWLFEMMPVVLVLYDAAHDRAYWVDVQEYAREHDLDVDEIGETVTLHIPIARLLNVDAIQAIRERKENVRRGLS